MLSFCLTAIFISSPYNNSKAVLSKADDELIKKELLKGTFPLINLSKNEKEIVLNCIYECLADLTISVKITRHGTDLYCYIVRPKIPQSTLNSTKTLNYIKEHGFRFGGKLLELKSQENNTSTKSWCDLLYNKSNHIKIESLLCYLRSLLGTEKTIEKGFSDFLSAINFTRYDASFTQYLFNNNHF